MLIFPLDPRNTTSGGAKVVPTFIQYMSTDENIWGTDDDVTADTMQRIWDFIYGAEKSHRRSC